MKDSYRYVHLPILKVFFKNRFFIFSDLRELGCDVLCIQNLLQGEFRYWSLVLRKDMEF